MTKKIKKVSELMSFRLSVLTGNIKNNILVTNTIDNVVNSIEMMCMNEIKLKSISDTY